MIFYETDAFGVYPDQNGCQKNCHHLPPVPTVGHFDVQLVRGVFFPMPIGVVLPLIRSGDDLELDVLADDLLRLCGVAPNRLEKAG